MSVKLTIEVPPELFAALRDGTASNAQRAAALDAIESAAQHISQDASQTQQADAQPTQDDRSPCPLAQGTSTTESAQSTTPGDYQVFLKKPNGKTLVLMVSKTMKVRQLEQQVYMKEGVPPDFQRLRMLSGRLLSAANGNSTLEECGVTQHSTIVLRLGRSGTTKADRVKKSGTGDQRYVGPSSATDPNPQVDFVIQVRNVSVNYEQRFWNIFGHDSTPVERLKFAIEKLSGIKQERQRLVLGGSELKDDQQTIGEVRAKLGVGPISMVVSRQTSAT